MSEGAGFGVSSTVAPLTRVILRRPTPSTVAADPSEWHYAAPLDAEAVVDSYDRLVEALADAGAEIVWLPDPGDGLADAVFCYDPSFVTPAGAVLLRMGKPQRRAEVDLHERLYERLGVPIVGRIEEPGTVEGGDCFWLDDRTVAVGRGFRTNGSGIEQLRALLAPGGVQVTAFDLPVAGGPASCLHLMSLISMLDQDLAIVHEPLLPVALYQQLRERGVTLLRAPEDEVAASAGLTLNVLATSPRRCIAVDGFPRTLQLLRDAGCAVEVYDPRPLSIPCEGGPTCMTRPLQRR